MIGLTPPGAASPAVVREPIAYCPRAAQPPIVDGRLGDACWAHAAAITGFELLRDAGPAREQTVVYLLHDAQGLYLGFNCLEPQMDRLKTTEKAYIWRNDSVEVLIDADRDRQGYFQFVLDVSGRRVQIIDGIPAESPNREWAGRWESAVSRGPDYWKAEIFIPASTLGARFRQGLALRANFARNEQGLVERSSWSPRFGPFANAVQFGNVVLGGPSRWLTLDLAEPCIVTPDALSLVLALENRGPRQRAAALKLRVTPRGGEEVTLPESVLRSNSRVRVRAHAPLPQEPQCGLDIWAQVRGRRDPVFLGSCRVTVPPRRPAAIGGVLARLPWGDVWEACVTSKVVPEAVPPREERSSIEVFSAKNEYEPFQVVVTPRRELENLRVRIDDLRGPTTITSASITVRQAETVNVREPTSPDCAPGEYPDPLVPLTSVTVPAGRSTALWFTVHVSRDAKAGDYRGQIVMEADGIDSVTLPVRLHVWDFALPEVPHLRSAYGVDYDALCRWHGARTREDKRRIAELINRNFIEHRICPYRPMKFWDVKASVTDGRVKTDFSEFDQAASRFLPRMNSFNVPTAWMGSVAGIGRDEPGYETVKVQFVQQLGEYLKQRGWLDKAYNYIYDEPDEVDYPKVIREAQLWRKGDPAIKILLTEQPEEALFGHVDIWTPVLDAYNRPNCTARQKLGEEVWWYVCTGPKHPFPNNFIDYPALDHRVLHWMTWKYQVTGILYWQTMYWINSPYDDPMSRDYDGKKLLGNGDGNLLYPAVRQPPETPLFEGPVNSIRWEMIREGMEDYDYFCMLHDALKTANGDAAKRGKTALALVDDLVRSTADYEKDPRRYHAARRSIGEALEALLRANRAARN